jgi:mevalonate kinase
MGHQEYYSSGKLLITGEYFVLKGAGSLALPLRLGQTMTIDNLKDEHGKMFWKSYYRGEVWFEATFGRNTFEIVTATNTSKALYIQNLLKQASFLNSEMFSDPTSLSISTTLGFHPEWGLGSSSSLIANLALWTKTDPYLLLHKTTGGSGYDIACAKAKGPICYTLTHGKPESVLISFKPAFRDSLYFVYLGNKINTTESISKNWHLLENSDALVGQITELTNKMIAADSVEEFKKLTIHHEEIVAKALQTITIQKQQFSDFEGCIKSLGAWGGDFVMAVSTQGKASVEAYFKRKGLSVIFTYNDLIL